EAACRVQDAGVTQVLVAFVVPSNVDAPPDEQKLRDVLRAMLPTHMVPARIATLPVLPTTLGGELDRRSRSTIDLDGHSDDSVTVMPRNPAEARIVAAFAAVLELSSPPSVTADFFVDLGGDSLSAALAVFSVQEDPAMAAITVRDLYDHPTAVDLATLAAEPIEDRGESPRPRERHRPVQRPVAATVFQSAWLFMDFVVASLVSYGVVFHAPPAVRSRLRRG